MFTTRRSTTPLPPSVGSSSSSEEPSIASSEKKESVVVVNTSEVEKLKAALAATDIGSNMSSDRVMKKPTGGALENMMPSALTRALHGPHGRIIKLCWCVFGVIGSLLAYGVLQERVMTRPFYYTGEEAEPEPKPEMFKYSVFIVLCNRIVSCFVALIAINVSKTSMKPVAPIHKYFAVSLSNVVATTCQYEALRYVSFPVQTLGKCAKMIPVMIWGYFISKKRYGVKDYAIALGVTLGCTVFLLYGDQSTISSKASSKKTMAETSIYGLMLMLGYLGFDGFTSTFQDKLFKGYQMETYNQMLYITGCSVLLSLFTLFTSRQMGPALVFLIRHPDCFGSIMMLSMASTMGQLFILYTIKEFGALLFATIMTTRQFLSILLSCVLFAHPLTWPQWGGTGMVFGSLYYKAFKGKEKKNGPGAASDATALSLEEDDPAKVDMLGPRDDERQ